MRKNSVGMSGSSIYSDANKFHELYLDVIEHIEIGQFSSEQDFNKFLELNSQKISPLESIRHYFVLEVNMIY